MKKEKGITLISLIVYITVMLIVTVTMSMITNNFYKNTTGLQGNVKEVIEFNKFNMYFLKEIKTLDNGIDSITENYILFNSGNSFSLSGNRIYYNNMTICEGIKEFKLNCEKDDLGNYNGIINVNIKFNEFNKSINYKLENIY